MYGYPSSVLLNMFTGCPFITRSNSITIFPPASPPHAQALFTVQPLELLVVHVPLALQHDADAPVDEPAPPGGDLAYLLAARGVVKRTFSPDRILVGANQRPKPTLRELIIRHKAERRVPSVAWRPPWCGPTALVRTRAIYHAGWCRDIRCGRRPLFAAPE